MRRLSHTKEYLFAMIVTHKDAKFVLFARQLYPKVDSNSSSKESSTTCIKNVQNVKNVAKILPKRILHVNMEKFYVEIAGSILQISFVLNVEKQSRPMNVFHLMDTDTPSVFIVTTAKQT